MKRGVFVLTAAILTTLPVCSQQLSAADPGQLQAATAVSTPTRLANVKTIFVAPLGGSEGSDLIRQKVINRLVKSGIVSVTESPEDADAILTGASGISQRHYLSGSMNYGYGYVSGQTRFSADCAVRLLSKNKRVLWTDEVTSRRLFSGRSVGGASSNAADKLVKGLIDAISADKDAVAGRQQTTH